MDQATAQLVACSSPAGGAAKASVPFAAGRGRRLLYASLAAACLGVLLIAAWLRPDPAGTGTHQQLGLPACNFLVVTGLPCASCGMTTAFALAAHGHPLAAWQAQPAGAAAALATAMAAWIFAWGAVSGASLAPVGRRLWRPRLMWAAGLLIVGAWGYKLAGAIWG